MQDNLYNIGDEIWFYEKANINADGNTRLFNGYVVSWSLKSGNKEYVYAIMMCPGITKEKLESELFIKRDDAANKMSGIVVDPIIDTTAIV